MSRGRKCEVQRSWGVPEALGQQGGECGEGNGSRKLQPPRSPFTGQTDGAAGPLPGSRAHASHPRSSGGEQGGPALGGGARRAPGGGDAESHVWALVVTAGAGGQEEGLRRPLRVHLLCAWPWATAPSFPFLLSVNRPPPNLALSVIPALAPTYPSLPGAPGGLQS